MDKIKDSGLTAEEKRLGQLQTTYNEQVRIIKESLDTTRADMQRDIDWKIHLRDTYENDYLPKIRAEHLDALNNYNAGISIIEHTWGKDMVNIWEATAGSIEMQRNKIMQYKADIAGFGTGITYVPPETMGPLAPGYRWLGSKQHGTPYVPQTGLYTLHQGEAVIPKHQNTSGRGKTIIKVEMPPITINAVIKNETSIENLGSRIGSAIAAGFISGVDSEFEIG